MAVRKRTRINYLSNTELLYEINQSKKTYSYFLDDKYSDFTVIINDFSEITDELIERAKIIKANQLNQTNLRNLAKKDATKSEIDAFMAKNHITEDMINLEDIVFRMMTFDHIPSEVQKNKKNLLNRIHFPPFKHYAYRDGELVEVGRSHWVGGLQNGHYSSDHGKVSSNLSLAMIKLANRYGTKANFSGYSYLDEMKGQALLQLSTVCLQFDESRSNNPFSYFSQIIKTSFIKVLKLEKHQRNIRDEIMQQELGMSSLSYQMDNEDY